MHQIIAVATVIGDIVIVAIVGIRVGGVVVIVVVVVLVVDFERTLTWDLLRYCFTCTSPELA